jgi:hypothetical protein
LLPPGGHTTRVVEGRVVGSTVVWWTELLAAVRGTLGDSRRPRLSMGLTSWLRLSLGLVSWLRLGFRLGLVPAFTSTINESSKVTSNHQRRSHRHTRTLFFFRIRLWRRALKSRSVLTIRLPDAIGVITDQPTMVHVRVRVRPRAVVERRTVCSVVDFRAPWRNVIDVVGTVVYGRDVWSLPVVERHDTAVLAGFFGEGLQGRSERRG